MLGTLESLVGQLARLEDRIGQLVTHRDLDSVVGEIRRDHSNDSQQATYHIERLYALVRDQQERLVTAVAEVRQARVEVEATRSALAAEHQRRVGAFGRVGVAVLGAAGAIGAAVIAAVYGGK